MAEVDFVWCNKIFEIYPLLLGNNVGLEEIARLSLRGIFCGIDPDNVYILYPSLVSYGTVKGGCTAP